MRMVVKRWWWWWWWCRGQGGRAVVAARPFDPPSLRASEGHVGCMGRPPTVEEVAARVAEGGVGGRGVGRGWVPPWGSPVPPWGSPVPRGCPRPGLLFGSAGGCKKPWLLEACISGFCPPPAPAGDQTGNQQRACSQLLSHPVTRWLPQKPVVNSSSQQSQAEKHCRVWAAPKGTAQKHCRAWAS